MQVRRSIRSSLRRGEGPLDPSGAKPQALARSSTRDSTGRDSGKIAGHVRATGDGVQRPHGHRVLVHGFRAAGREDRAPRRRLGSGALRRQVRAQLPGTDARLHQRHGRVHPQAPDQDAAGDRARAPEDARARVAGEHAPVQARVVGPPLHVRAQRDPAAREAPPAARRAPAGRDRQRARLLLDDRTAARRLPRRLSPAAAAAVAGDRRAGAHAGRRRESSTSCSPTAATCSRAAGPSSATSSARRRSGARRCATPRCRSTSRR